MPVWILAGLAGAAGGYFLGKGTESLAGVVKWGVIGAGLYVGARALKVL